MPNLTTRYSPSEEMANSISHGLGLLLSLIGLTLMVLLTRSNSDPVHLISALVFGLSLSLLFLASTLYHSIGGPETKAKLKLLDHSAIYILIAGTYTPFLLISLHGTFGFTLLGTVWGMAILGIFCKLYLRHRFARFSLFSYLLMGWMGIIALPEMINQLTKPALILLAAGGSAYTLGAVFYAWQKLAFNHAIWHLFVLAGSICHFLAIYLYVLQG